MAAAKRRGAALGAGVLLGAIAAASMCRIVEHDAAWLLRAGEEILRRRALIDADPFSYTTVKPWMNHEWLTEVLLAASYRAGGFLALGVVQGLGCAAAVAALLWGVGRPGGDGRIASSPGLAGLAPIAAAAVGAVLRESSAPRAQLLAQPIFALTLALALRERDRPRLLLLVPLLGVLLTQLHGGNPALVLLLAARFATGPTALRAVALVGAALATCAGPYGVHVHEHYLRGRLTLEEFAEWRPAWTALRQGAPIWIEAALLVLAGVVALAVRRRRGEPIAFEALALCGFATLAALHLRFAGEAAMVAAVALSPALTRVPLRAPFGLLAGLGLFCASLAVSAREPGIGFDPRRFPVGAASFLARERPRGPMFNSYNFGGYLMWAYPEEKVFIDGRSLTAYTEQQMQELLALYRAPERFAALEERWRFGFAVLQREGRGAPLAVWLQRRATWRVAYEDDLAVVLVRTGVAW